MGLEAITYISDMVATNPVVGDDVAQGDDHIRGLKVGLRTTFPNADRAQYFRRTIAKSADYSVLATDMSKTFLVDTTGGNVALTLPTLASGDDGWECHFIKTNTGTNPLYIVPPSGTIQSGEVSGLAKCRRVIPGLRCTAVWTGAAWIVTRNCNTPVGGFMEGQWSSLPVGFELPNGQTLNSTNYPEFYSANGSSGVTLDITGRVTAMQEASATRLTTAGAGVDGATKGSAGGNQIVDILRTDLPNFSVTPAGTLSGSGTASGAMTDGISTLQNAGSGSPFNGTPGTLSVSLAGVTLNGTPININGGVTQTHLNKLPPIIVVKKVLVVE